MKSYVHRINYPRPRFLWSLLGILIIALLWLHWGILAKFNFIYFDMDQVLMWYGTQEIREGRFHMPRYFGQDYGTMLEAWLAAPFTFIHYNKLLPLVAYAIGLLPYFFLLFVVPSEKRMISALFLLGFIAIMPVEYIMILAMPRDMNSGIFICSLAFLFIRGDRWINYFLVGFFALLGWSFNANSALLGVLLVAYSAFCRDEIKWDRWLALFSGLAAAYLIHFGMEWYIDLHPELIVQRKWDFEYSLSLLWSGLMNLNVHWGWLTPVFGSAGLIYLVTLMIALFFALVHQHKKLFYLILLFSGFLLATLGIEKIHDGIDGIFFSHERMYMALPLAMLFLLLQFPMRWRIGTIFFTLGFFMILHQRANLEETVAFHKNPDHNTFLTVMDWDQLNWRCEEIENWWNETDAQAVFYGPGVLVGDWVMARGCPCLTEIDHMVRPEYERKTWELRDLDSSEYTSFLWISQRVDDQLLSALPIKYRLLETSEYYGNVYHISSEGLSPMEIYKLAGFESVAY